VEKPRKLALLIITAFGVTLAYSVARAVDAVRGHRAELRQFDETHGPDKLLGLTGAEILATFGKPDSVTRDAGGAATRIVYSKYGRYCDIHLANGVARQVILDSH
jgi:hypothetical protein